MSQAQMTLVDRRITANSRAPVYCDKAVAKAHQGRVELSSILGKGGCFKLILPLHKVASPRAMVVGE